MNSKGLTYFCKTDKTGNGAIAIGAGSVADGNGEKKTILRLQFSKPFSQQRLTEVNRPDHTLITYPNLGLVFSPSSQWSTGIGPFEQYVLADIYAWLEAQFSSFTFRRY